MITSWFSDTTNRIMGCDPSVDSFALAFSFGVRSKTPAEGTVARSFYGYACGNESLSSSLVAKLNLVYDVDFSTRGLIINNVNYDSLDSLSEGSLQDSFYLFKVNRVEDDSTDYKKEFNGRFYRTKIWDGSKLSMDLIPAYNESTKYYGMYDHLNEVFYPCSNKTVFSGK